MKKLSVAVFSAALSCAAFAAVESTGMPVVSGTESHSTVPCQVSFAPPLQFPDSSCAVAGFRWNILYGASYSVTGFDLGLVGLTHQKMTGLQINGLGAWDDSDMTGAQISSLADVVCGNATGLQLASALNYVRGDFAGVQIASLNYNGAYTGAQIGAVNYNKGVGRGGLQIGLANVNRTECTGLAIGGVNYTERLFGCQIGVCNVAVQEGHGLQIGLFNAAETYSGLQIGVLNVIGNGELPIFPVINAMF